MTKITNTSKAILGVNAKVDGKVRTVSLAPGETKDLDVIKTKVFDARVKSGALSVIAGKAKADAAPKQDEQPKTAAEVLELADGNFMTFKAAASKVLGDDTPSTKDEIIAALKAKADA
ncbi:hypothetical protein NO932_11610 [Pelagibacterium sp. 26DY04]|uniref:hypothetical protein n=1 Tax=Pelagibacterium sp. 26DY04 TaxID=2967130 RepID=UPI0028169193|nr:hypothetical protein [Pelagibacterium sp. 26DY04]WMT85574.1 hypothetical protein NO932_11610 [Pelagibacterium sp. 26DY04]